MNNYLNQTVFSKDFGNAENYRIPSIIRTNKGTLVACADERYFTGADNPNRIDKVVRRSVDNGVTWGTQIVAVKEFGKSKMSSSSAIDPSLLYDGENDVIYMLYVHTPSTVGILHSKKGTGYDASGRARVTVNKKAAYVHEDGTVKMANGKDSGYTVENGIVKKDGKEIGDIYTGNCAVKEHETFYLYICKSTDDGLTWSKPECLNEQVKAKYMSFIGACPGVGIKISKGKYAGRLVFPIYYNTITVGLSLSSCVIYSDDDGATWQRGKSPNDGRRHGIFKLSSRFVGDFDMITESQVIELPDGSLRMFMRNHSGKRRITMAESSDGGATWQNYRFNPVLVHPICQISAINAQYKGKEVTLVCNAADKKRRVNGTVRLSYDYGETFECSARVKEGEFVYSSMVQTADGDIFMLYEGSTRHETIEGVKFPISAIEKGETLNG